MNTSNFSHKKKGFILSLLTMTLLTGCNINNQHPAPITELNKNYPTQTPKLNPSETSMTSSSYPLPPTPEIETTSSYSVNNPQLVSGDSNELIITPDSEIILESLGQPVQPNDADQSSQSIKGIASKSPLIVNTPKINYVAKEGEPNWQKMSLKAIEEMLASDTNIKTLSGNLYVNSVSNQTNSTLPVYVIDQLLMQISAENTPFSVASLQKVNDAKKQLNIPANDTLITTSKSLAIAKAMDAPYILFSSISGDGGTTTLSVQLIDTSSAEILAQGTSSIEF